MTQAELPSAPLNAIVRPLDEETESTHIARLLWLRGLFGDRTSEDLEEQLPLDLLADKMTEFLLPRGTPLYEAGSTSDSLFFIMEGAVRQGQRGYTRFVPGDVLGFVDAMTDSLHRFTAVAEVDSVVLRLRLDDWLIFIEDHPQIVRRLVRQGRGMDRPRPDAWGQDPDVAATLLADAQDEDSPSASFVRRLLAARATPLLRRAGIQALAQLVHSAKIIGLGATTPLTSPSPGLWIVVRGTVRSKAGPSAQDAEEHDFPPGTLLYSLSSLEQMPDFFETRAVTGAELMLVPTEDFFETMQDHFDLVRSALAYMAEKVREQNEQILV